MNNLLVDYRMSVAVYMRVKPFSKSKRLLIFLTLSDQLHCLKHHSRSILVMLVRDTDFHEVDGAGFERLVIHRRSPIPSTDPCE